jgi:hypothetical protein
MFGDMDFAIGFILPIVVMAAAATLAVVFGVPWVWGFIRPLLAAVLA